MNAGAAIRSNRHGNRPDDAVYWRRCVALTTVLIVLLVGHYVMRIPFDDLVGVASGATGNPAILVYSTRDGAVTERPDIGYAMIFPSMTIVKVIAVQIIGLLAIGNSTGAMT